MLIVFIDMYMSQLKMEMELKGDGERLGSGKRARGKRGAGARSERPWRRGLEVGAGRGFGGGS